MRDRELGPDPDRIAKLGKQCTASPQPEGMHELLNALSAGDCLGSEALRVHWFLALFSGSAAGALCHLTVQVLYQASYSF